MIALTTYEEKRFDGHRTFELFEDRIVVEGKKSLGAEFEYTVMLKTLEPQLSKVRRRNRGFGQGISMALISIALLQSGAGAPLSYWGGLTIVMTIGGVLLTLSTVRKVEWACFKTKAGVLALSIARAGKQEASYEPFVKALVAQIALN